MKNLTLDRVAAVMDRVRVARGWRAGLIAALAGAAAVLGHAPFHLWPVFALAIMVLGLLVEGAGDEVRPLAAGFWRAWAFGFGHFLAGMFWIGHAFLVDAEKFAPLMPFAVSALPATLALFWGAAGALAAKWRRHDARQIALLAGLLGLGELARGTLFTGLPWNLPAYVWSPGGWISQAGAIVGPYGVSVLTLAVFLAPLHWRARGGRAAGALAAGLVLLGVGHGIWRLNLPEPAPPGPMIAAGQAGFTQKEVWDPANRDRVIEGHLALLDAPAARDADIVVLPEAAFPFLLLEQEPVIEALAAKLGDRALIVGAVRRDFDARGERYHNSILLLDAPGGVARLRGLYDKHHLVPFGEYLPRRDLFERLGVDSLVAYASDMTPGPQPDLLSVPGAPDADARVCYEIVFPSFNDANRGRAGWILNVSIDAWYGDALGPDQHFAQARWRAIEAGLPLVRAASGGWSGVVDARGRIVSATRAGPALARGRLPGAMEITPFARFGWPMSAIIVVFTLSLSFFPRLTIDSRF
jgi:apolipoprotein N-acyltransferase